METCNYCGKAFTYTKLHDYRLSNYDFEILFTLCSKYAKDFEADKILLKVSVENDLLQNQRSKEC